MQMNNNCFSLSPLLPQKLCRKKSSPPACWRSWQQAFQAEFVWFFLENQYGGAAPRLSLPPAWPRRSMPASLLRWWSTQTIRKPRTWKPIPLTCCSIPICAPPWIWTPPGSATLACRCVPDSACWAACVCSGVRQASFLSKCSNCWFWLAARRRWVCTIPGFTSRRARSTVFNRLTRSGSQQLPAWKFPRLPACAPQSRSGVGRCQRILV